MPHNRRHGWNSLGSNWSRIRRGHVRNRVHLRHEWQYPRYIHRPQRSFEPRGLLSGFHVRRHNSNDHVLLHPHMGQDDLAAVRLYISSTHNPLLI